MKSIGTFAGGINLSKASLQEAWLFDIKEYKFLEVGLLLDIHIE